MPKAAKLKWCNWLQWTYIQSVNVNGVPAKIQTRHYATYYL